MVHGLSQAYTPGLKVKRLTIVRENRRLPVSGKILVKEGDSVKSDTIVATANLPSTPEVVEVADSLGVDPEDIERYMLKRVGDPVKKNETISQLRLFFGLVSKACASPIEGVIDLVSDTTGKVFIRPPDILVELRAYIPGKITNVFSDQEVVIETPAALVQGIFGVGGEKEGKLMMVANSPDEELTADRIGPECAGKVLVGGSLVTISALRRMRDIGAVGTVVGGIDNKDLAEFVGYEIGVAITGQEDVSPTLILTEGFGKISMANRTFRLLQSLEGKRACINGATQIRAGVIRPEIIVPLEALQAIETDGDLTAGMSLGTYVRVIRDPYLGFIGRITDLPVNPQRIDTESYARVLELELENGEKIIVPRANVELIEE